MRRLKIFDKETDFSHSIFSEAEACPDAGGQLQLQLLSEITLYNTLDEFSHLVISH